MRKNCILILIVFIHISCGRYTEKTYWPNKNLKSKIVRYKETDLYAGKYLLYYPNGKKKEEQFFKRDLPRKKSTEWYDNGNVKINKSISFVKDSIMFEVIDNEAYKTRVYLMDYTETQYYENGEKQHHGQYKRNRKEGLWLFFDSNGVAIQEKIYLNDSVVNKN